jgi:DNA repair exonuclease SbcCD nuclease subunit
MRFLHLADVHLDTPFAGRSALLRERLREATRDAFSRALDRAVEAEVDAVLIAGDLLDGSALSLETEYFLLERVHDLTRRGIPLFYATGNHDPGTAERPAHRISWPRGVEVFADDVPRTVPVLRRGDVVGTVTGIGHATAREGRDLSRMLQPPGGGPLPSAGVPAVALLHTQVVGAGSAAEHDRYAPSTLAYLRSTTFDYWALGHIHQPQCLESRPGIWYPGNPQGRSPRETGSRGGLLVELDAPGALPRITPVPLGLVRWEILQLDGLEALGDIRALMEHIQALWQGSRREDPGLPNTEWMVRIELRGPSPLARRLEAQDARTSLEQMLRDSLGLLDVEVRQEALFDPISVDTFRSRPDAVGEVFRLLEDVTADPLALDPLARMKALGLEPTDLAGVGTQDPEAVAAYVLALLEGADRWLAHRFTPTGGPQG